MQTVRAAGGGAAAESSQEQAGSMYTEQAEGQGVPQGTNDAGAGWFQVMLI